MVSQTERFRMFSPLHLKMILYYKQEAHLVIHAMGPLEDRFSQEQDKLRKIHIHHLFICTCSLDLCFQFTSANQRREFPMMVVFSLIKMKRGIFVEGGPLHHHFCTVWLQLAK